MQFIQSSDCLLVHAKACCRTRSYNEQFSEHQDLIRRQRRDILQKSIHCSP